MENVMPYNPQIHHRQSTRLRGYDYSSAGAYFITICTHQRECIFGEIVDEVIRPNAWGEIVATCWHEIAQHFPTVELDAFVLMPNHVHGIVVIVAPPSQPSPIPKLGQIIAYFKYQSTKRINLLRDQASVPIWQRNYYDRIIRDDKALDAIREYIAANPIRWALDKENPIVRR